MPAVLDTLKFAKRLKAAGMAAQQAEAFAEAVAEGISQDLATKADLAVLEDRVNHRLSALEGELAASESRFDAMLAALESHLLRWMGAGFVATIAALAALIQFAHR